MRSRLASSAVSFLVLACLLALPAPAGGPRSVNGAGQPMVWPAAPIVYRPDQGSLGKLSNAEARALVAQAFDEWEAVGVIAFVEGAILPEDVDAAGYAFDNDAHFKNFYRVNGDGISPVIFDADGSIIDALFGEGARFQVLGLGGLDDPIDGGTTVTGASIILNGAFYDGLGLPSSPEDLSREAYRGLIVHEIGHFLNLDHSVVNHELAEDGNAGNDIYVPTMYPFAVADEEALASLNPDDVMALRMLYDPAAPVTDLSGSVKAGGLPFQGALVVLRKTDDRLLHAYSVISGGLHFPCHDGTPCNPCNASCPANPPEQGAWVATHLPAGSYEICVEQIDTRIALANDTFVGPLATPSILTGPEECRDVTESSTATADDPDDALAVSGTGTNLDVLLTSLPVSDPQEPNNTLATGATLVDLPSGADTTLALLPSGDVDVYNVPVVAGQRLRVDVEAAELGSTVDTVLGFYNASNALVALVDDAVDPDSRRYSFDPALDLVAGFTGTGKLVVSSYPDLDQNGSGGASSGPYWIRVQVTTDTDGDGAADAVDVCPLSARDDPDRDTLCFSADNCPTYANPSQAEQVRLNGALPTGGDVIDFEPDALGVNVVYIASQDDAGVYELYSVPAGGGASTKLSGALVSGGNVIRFNIAPDGSRVIYRADKEVDGKFELYSVPIGGGASTKLNGALVAGGNISQFYYGFQVSPDSQRVIYVADQDTDEVNELYSVPVAGGTVTKLNGALVTGGDVSGPLISPDGSRVVYHADEDTDDVFELYSVPVAGGTVTKLNGPLAGGYAHFFFMFSPDGTKLLYMALQDTVDQYDLYIVPTAGGTPLKLNGALVTGGDINEASFAFTPDGSRVLYVADQDTDGVAELYSVASTGGAVTKLNAPLVAGGNLITIHYYRQVSADSTTVVYQADQDTDEAYELYRVPITGGTPVKISGPLTPGGSVDFSYFSPSNATLLYIADQDTDGVAELYSVPMAGGTPVKLNGPLVPGGGVVDMWFTPDGATVIYLADAKVAGQTSLYSVPIGGGTAPVRLDGPSAAGSSIYWFYVSPDGSRVTYFSDQEADDVDELFCVDTIAGGDLDADGVLNGCDNCPEDANANQLDADGNGVGDACAGCTLGTDPDSDAVCGAADNCPTIANANQADLDGDGVGNACDADDDDDGLSDAEETATGTDPSQADMDGDGATDGDEVFGGSDPADPVSAPPPPASFASRPAVSTSAVGAQAVVAADLDGDGDQDLVSAAFDINEIAWYENDGGPLASWAKSTLHGAANEPHGPRSVFAADIDRDGDIDVVSASFSDDLIIWWENNGASQPSFTNHEIANNADAARSVFAADLDGDGDIDVLSASANDNKIAWYENDGAALPAWTTRTISTAATVARSVFAADVDGDGDTDVLSASEGNDTVAWYENNGAAPPTWTTRTITATADGAQSVFAVDVDRDGDLDALSASFNDDKIAWYRNDGSAPPNWTPFTITTTADVARSVFASDMDGDGDVDVLSASAGDDRVAWYENLGTTPPFWTVRTITSVADGVRSVQAADVDGDGDADVLSASELDGEIDWYENRTIHRSARLETRRTISTAVVHPYSILAADLDADGDADALASSFNDDKVIWYESNGFSPPGWTARTITTAADEAESVAVADVNGDGDMDVLSASFGDDTVAWYESDGAHPPTFTEHTISTGADGALWVEPADLDGDGDVDVLASTMLDNGLVWFDNDGAAVPGFTERTISTTAPFKRGLATGDLDGDGDLDVLAVLVGPGLIAWYENDGAVPPAWTPHTVNPIGIGTPGRVRTADLDGDGDLDVASAEYAGNSIFWFENNGAASPSFTSHSISTSNNGWFSIVAEDLDADGDVDLASASVLLSDRIVWWENDGEGAPTFTEREVSSTVGDTDALAVGDLDNDGDLDLLATEAGAVQHRVAWYENVGGQFTQEAEASPGQEVLAGSSTPLLTIYVTSNGRNGDTDLDLATLVLLVTDGEAKILTSDEANALIERIRVWLDTGSDEFEPGSDLLVATVETLELAPLVIPLPAGDPRVRLAADESRTYFVVVDTVVDSNGTFKLVHVTESAAQARDAATGAPLSMELRPNVTTDAIDILADATSPFVTAVFPPHGMVDLSPATDVVLFFNEPVDATSAALGVTLSNGAGKVPGQVTVSPDGLSVRFDAESLLVGNQDYVVQVTSTLTDRAGNPALAFSSTFDTAAGGAATIGAAALEEGTGITIPGSNEDDRSGFAAAAVGDVNNDGIDDLLIGAPFADPGEHVDAGEARLIFGSPALQSGNPPASLRYETGSNGESIGESVARGGDLDDDGIADLLVGAPHSDANGTLSGVIYVVFGDTGLDEIAPAAIQLDNVGACLVPTACGLKLLGTAGDLAGTALAAAGDVNHDGYDDLAIGAPGASPGGRTGAGRVYLLYGPLSPGTILLSDVGGPTPGLVFNGENADDAAGTSVSPWKDVTGDGVDDLLIGAPGATTLDSLGNDIEESGWVYAVQGGTGPGHLTTAATPGVVELGRVANGATDQVGGVVFLGAESGGHLGRTVTGEVDTDGDGTDDVVMSADGRVFAIPGDGPKTVSGGSRTGGTQSSGNSNVAPDGGLLRALGALDALDDFGGLMYDSGDQDLLTAGPAGDVNHDGFDDLIIGAPFASGPGGSEAGRAYVIYGSPAPGSGERSLAAVGLTIAGLTVEGAAAGDHLGASVGGGGDLNADGVDDALVGAPFADPGAQANAGRTYVISPLHPEEVLGVRLSRYLGTTLIEWTVPDLASEYNVYRGLLSVLKASGQVRTSNMLQLACGITTNVDADLLPDTTDSASPGPGAAFVYLVTATNQAGEGPLGPAGEHPLRLNDQQCP